MNVTAKRNKDLPNFLIKDKNATNVHVLQAHNLRTAAMLVQLDFPQQVVEVRTEYNKGSLEANKRDIGESPVFGFRLFEIVNGVVTCELPRVVYAQIPRGTLEDTAIKTDATVQGHFSIVQQPAERFDQYQERVLNNLTSREVPDFNTYWHFVQQAIAMQATATPMALPVSTSVLGKRAREQAELEQGHSKFLKFGDSYNELQEVADPFQLQDTLDQEIDVFLAWKDVDPEVVQQDFSIHIVEPVPPLANDAADEFDVDQFLVDDHIIELPLFQPVPALTNKAVDCDEGFFDVSRM
jgi:hypothetical protein